MCVSERVMSRAQSIEEEGAEANRRARVYCRTNHDDKRKYADDVVTNGSARCYSSKMFMWDYSVNHRCDEAVVSHRSFGHCCCMSREGNRIVELEGRSGHPSTFLNENNITSSDFTFLSTLKVALMGRKCCG
ncbi:hypothetical protein TNCV_3948351 [Trichonephila clavipes]|nr:hypothetical protein TNCV_3948351 [Trichonephila clavipes]